MLNKIYITGKIIESKHDREVQFGDNKVIQTTLMVAQQVREGTGYNGSNYSNVFYSLEYPQRLRDPKIAHKSEVLVEGKLMQNKGKDGKTYTKIKASSVRVLIHTDTPNKKVLPKDPSQADIDSDNMLFED